MSKNEPVLKTVSLAIRKLTSALDRPKSILDLRSDELVFESQASYVERNVIREFAWMLRDGQQCIYDVGAHDGTFAKAFSRLSNVDSIVSFEPLPGSFKRLEKVASTSSKITPLNLALGNVEGEVDFYRNEFSASSSTLEMDELHKRLYPHTSSISTVTVSMARMDDVIAEQKLPSPTILKLDVQGGELSVLEGGRNALRSANYCVAEVSTQNLYVDAPSFDDMNDFLRNEGFEFAGTQDQIQPDPFTAPIQTNVIWARKK